MATKARETTLAQNDRKEQQTKRSRVITPSDYFSSLLNKVVVIRISNGTEMIGHLAGFDVNLNCVLMNAEEKIQGKIKSFYDCILVRGECIHLIHRLQEKQAIY